MNMKMNISSMNRKNKTKEPAYLSEQLKDIPNDRKNVFLICGNVVVNCCVGNTRVSVDDFVKDLCDLELRI